MFDHGLVGAYRYWSLLGVKSAPLMPYFSALHHFNKIGIYFVSELRLRWFFNCWKDNFKLYNVCLHEIFWFKFYLYQICSWYWRFCTLISIFILHELVSFCSLCCKILPVKTHLTYPNSTCLCLKLDEINDEICNLLYLLLNI